MNYDAYIFDQDGTIYLGEQTLPGAAETIAALRAAGKRTIFLSNNPTKTREQYALKLSHMGIATPLEDIVNSSFVLVQWLLHLLQHGAAGQELRQHLVQLPHRVGLVEAEGLLCAFGPVTEAVPDLALQILVPAEQQSAWRIACDEYAHRLRLREAGQVKEIAVEAVRVVGVTIPQPLWRGRDHRNAALHLLRQP
jgi:hypothetical protein